MSKLYTIISVSRVRRILLVIHTSGVIILDAAAAFIPDHSRQSKLAVSLREMDFSPRLIPDSKRTGKQARRIGDVFMHIAHVRMTDENVFAKKLSYRNESF
jgi:hypothetical protein